jgi:cyclic-di-GMP-binding protein
MPTFDIVSELDKHELDNAIQQASKEVGTRFDFRNTDTSIERSEDGILLKANGENRLEAAYGVLSEKLAKRGINPRNLDPQKIEVGSKGHVRQQVKLKQGLSKEKAKELVQFIKDGKFKVQAAIQGEQLRVTGKKRDELQEVIQAMRAKDFEQDLQFTNFRE